MGWFDGWFGGSSSGDSDPLRRLDPKLREFLEKESPIKYSTTTTPTAAAHQPTQSPSKQPQRPQPAAQQFDPAVPPQSLYQDGRYAHLWKTYRPLSAVEAETKSDHEKLTDVLEAYKARKAQIGRAALENCADEQLAWNDCMKSGGWAARMTMCRDAVHRFERCYAGQTRLLKALGYLSVHGRGADVDDDIQLRADELYRRVLDQEREMERARKEGREPPVFTPLLNEAAAPSVNPAGRAGTGSSATPRTSPFPEPSPATLSAWKERLEKLPPEDREAEEQALRAEHRAKAEMAAQIHGLWQEQAKERETRKAQGNETFIDRFTALFSSWSGPKSS